MKSVLVTAFGPYGEWTENASWLAVVALTAQLPEQPRIVTRLYPVEVAEMKSRVERDLREGFDAVLHVGQAPGAAEIALEAVAQNQFVADGELGKGGGKVAEGGPVAYESMLPLAVWADGLRQAGIPARVSRFAGTFLCNATLYWAHHVCAVEKLPTKAAFVHVPLTPGQAARHKGATPSMSSQLVGDALRAILAEISELP